MMEARTILTYDGLASTPDDGLRRELLGGELYVSPAPSPLHQIAVGEIFVALRTYAQQRGGRAFVSPLDVVFAQRDAVQPDVIYLEPDRLRLVGEKCIQGAPNLVVEVLSPSSSDVDPRRKLSTYARYAVPEYWIIDARTAIVSAYAEPTGDRYQHVAHSIDGVITSLTLPGLRFVLPALTR
jgi:Uma2 family endonuclease